MPRGDRQAVEDELRAMWRLCPGGAQAEVLQRAAGSLGVALTEGPGALIPIRDVIQATEEDIWDQVGGRDYGYHGA
jgi:hypothetical protein